MARVVLCVLALVACGLADPINKAVPHKNADPVLAQRQVDLSTLYFHIHEPIHTESCKQIASTWDIEKNIEHYSNVTATKIYVELLENDWLLPRGVPFSVFNHVHKFEVVTMFNMLFSAKDYNTFYKTAVYLRNRVNEELYVYVLNIAILNRQDTQGVVLPPIYEVFPSFFNNGEVMHTAQRINTHGFNMMEHYPLTYKWDENVVIRWNSTSWPYYGKSSPVSYFTHDHGLNALYYNYFLTYPSWLGGEVVPLVKDNRGEMFWFVHKQLLSRYYMERLSNGLGEIDILDLHVVKEGYTSGLLYHNGIPFPSRPNYYLLDQPDFVKALTQVSEYEHRIRDAIESGYFINSNGEHVKLSTPESIDVLGRLIEANVDSPNVHYFKDFISIWKSLLGNTYVGQHRYYSNNKYVPLVVPSVLEHYQTALRDPAFYVIWKRVMNLFTLWQQQLPHYKSEELALPSVAIEKVEVDKLTTYFEQSYMNVTNHLHMSEHESKIESDDVSVLVQHPRLNHKVFNIRVSVKSEVAKTVTVKIFLGPKYDSKGYEIPLHANTENFFMLDEFVHNLPVGESVITRASTDNAFTTHDHAKGYDVFLKAEAARTGSGQFVIDPTQKIDRFPHRLLLPKGHVGGMPFVFLVYISEYKQPKVPHATGWDESLSLGLGSGSRFWSSDPLGFPLNRPLHIWQIKGLRNIFLQDVLIYHKHTPEVIVPHTE